MTDAKELTLGQKKMSYEDYDNQKKERQNVEEAKDLMKQKELQGLKNQILKVAQHDLLPGYTEVLVGEKSKAYENEEDN